MIESMYETLRGYFVYHQTMDANHQDIPAARIAAAIGEPARARMLYALVDGHARTSTELAIVAEVSPSTASVHLNRLKDEQLVKLHVQGKHRYYSLDGPQVADVLEGLSVLAGARPRFVSTTPSPLRAARTCYDHIAGHLGVLVHDRFVKLKWLSSDPERGGDAYKLTTSGICSLERLGVDVEGCQLLRRRFAYACLDWSERRPHLGGALGFAFLSLALKKRWVVQELDSRILELTSRGQCELEELLGLPMETIGG